MAAIFRFITCVSLLQSSSVASAGTASPITTIHVADPSRKNKTVSAKICMPSGVKADPTAKLPLYIFGHGAGCAPEDYAYFCEVAVTALVFEWSNPMIDFNTHGLAEDAAFLAKALPKIAKEDKGSAIYGLNIGPVVLGGHSMGGGETVLAAASPSLKGISPEPVNGMAVFAPGLYTLPSARPFLVNVTVPALIVSGSNDCGPNALPKQALPAFDGLSSKTKVLVVLTGATHCGWAVPTERFFGICKMAKECGHLSPDKQRSIGSKLAEAFFTALSFEDSWVSFEDLLSEGEKNGLWTYISSVSSPAGKVVHNDCPCKTTTNLEDLSSNDTLVI
eukprot:TRINITY_DN33476_c0_g1_i1.p1 TRINITY_DN33476_c0_g1~~TRINITY_DN33476_c0_g1_i1.p1  ORF type:complete len:351 (+),score=58.00 TRINITY_DN33476_c0_g1_i1:53-1054(+)